MTEAKKRRWAAIIIACLLTLTVGWPLIGAVEGLFWAKQFHGGPRIDAIGRILDVAFDNPAYQPPLDKERREGANPLPDGQPNCEQLSEVREQTQGDDLLPANSTLNAAISHLRSDEYRGVVRGASFNGMASLPDFWLGAIDRCLSGSVLGSFCAAYAENQLDDIRQANSENRKQRFREANNRAEQAWCLAIGDLQHARKLSRAATSK